MCQLLGVSSTRPIRLSVRWEEFVVRGSVPGGNADGWGVALYEDADALLVREPRPASSSPTVQFLENNAPSTVTLVSHVRRAVQGSRCLANTQPFVRRLWGRTHVFAHNGFLPDYRPHPMATWGRPLGSTDSELMFCRLLAEVEPLWQQGSTPPLEQRASAITRVAAEFRAAGASNFLYSDGVTLFAHAHRKTIPGEETSTEPGLYLLERSRSLGHAMHQPSYGLSSPAECEHQSIVATVPIDDQPWQALSPGELVCLEQGRRRAP